MVFEPYNYGRLYYEPSPFLKLFHFRATNLKF